MARVDNLYTATRQLACKSDWRSVHFGLNLLPVDLFELPQAPTMHRLLKIFPLSHLLISLLFVVCAVSLIGMAALELWLGLNPNNDAGRTERLDAILEAIALLTVAVAALELGQTIVEEEVQREAQMSAPTRVRRFLSRFLVVLVVALSIEMLVLVFRSSREAPEQLPYASCVGLTAAALLAAWGVFIRFNRMAEELEPEAMEEAKREDEKVERSETE